MLQLLDKVRYLSLWWLQMFLLSLVVGGSASLIV